jgi:hypothetical protein
VDDVLDLLARRDADVLGVEEELDRERVAGGAQQDEVFLARQDELADGGFARLLERLEQKGVGLVRGLLRRYVVGAVVVDRVDLVDVDERDDVDRPPTLSSSSSVTTTNWPLPTS